MVPFWRGLVLGHLDLREDHYDENSTRLEILVDDGDGVEGPDNEKTDTTVTKEADAAVRNNRGVTNVVRG